MTTAANRLTAFRQHLSTLSLDGFIVPLTDEHMSEYVGTYARRLEWLTGFAGSAGSAVVLADRAAIFVDGRYTLQVRQQVDGSLYEYRSIPADSIWQWLKETAPKGARIGYDPWLHTRAFIRTVSEQLAGVATLVPVEPNPIDSVWSDQPSPSAAPAEIHPIEFAGQSSSDKRAALAKAMEAVTANKLVLAALDSIAWAFNIRGSDVPRTPVVRAFALIDRDGSATLFTDPAKISPEVAAHLGPDVQVSPYDSFARHLSELGGTRVMLDPSSTVVAIFEALEQAGATLIERRDPAVPLKAAKNEVELSGTRSAHRRDGLAVTRFLHSVDSNRPGDELEAEARLEDYRRQSNLLKDLSFDSISAFGPNAASPHYRSTAETSVPLSDGNLYLIDSGGQYPDGTTDITRTIAIGTPTAEMRDRFTRVLKGHIALATARFPKGTRGGQLDILARQYLWQAGLDYAHGTGHGVGCFLGVHEGPQRIAASAAASGIDEVLQPGMILSNEPGYYRQGHYGIRTENLVIVVEDKGSDDEEEMLAFETITLAPIDLRLVERSLLTPAEVEWLDSYHRRVREAHLDQLDGAGREWLLRATRPLAEEALEAA